MARGKLHVIYSGMFGGKTTRLISIYNDLIKSGAKVVAAKSSIDDRYTTEPLLYTHSDKSIPARLIPNDHPETLRKIVDDTPQVDTVLIDEVMFFPPEIVEHIDYMLQRGINVVAAGLDRTAELAPFGVMPHLMGRADRRTQLFATCDGCGSPNAILSYCKIDKDKDILVGTQNMYGAACVACHHKLHKGKVAKSSPCFPYMRRKGLHHDPIRIEVAADSMRVGKTTAVKILAEGLRNLGYQVNDSYEDWQHNPYLKDSYSDPEQNFLDSQKWFIKRKWEQVRDGAKDDIFIQDVSPEMDFCYAETNRRLDRMSEKHFSSYSDYFYSLEWDKTPAPDLLLYLQVSDDKLVERAVKSKREFEKIDTDYFLMMKKVNREWLERKTDDYTVLAVNTDDLNFADDPLAREVLVQKVVDKMTDFS